MGLQGSRPAVSRPTVTRHLGKWAYGHEASAEYAGLRLPDKQAPGITGTRAEAVALHWLTNLRDSGTSQKLEVAGISQA